MSLEGTIQNGVVVLDPDSPPLSDGTRVEITLRTGMEPLIRKTPGVIGGDACIGDHRIAVWMLIEMRRLGMSDAQLRESYPHVNPALFEAAWQYAAAHPAEIDQAIRENNEAE